MCWVDVREKGKDKREHGQRKGRKWLKDKDRKQFSPRNWNCAVAVAKYRRHSTIFHVRTQLVSVQSVLRTGFVLDVVIRLRNSVSSKA